MRRIIFTITLIFLCFYCFSQEKWDKSPVIKTNIFTLFMSRPSIALDVPISKKISIMPSASCGKFNWGDFGGLHKYKSYEVEVKSHRGNVYYGGYLKHTTKTIYSEEKILYLFQYLSTVILKETVLRLALRPVLKLLLEKDLI